MTFLIAQYTVVFVLTLVFGFLFGRWWVRRSFVDVTDSYQGDSQTPSAPHWEKTWSRIDEIDEAMRGFSEAMQGVPEVVSGTLRHEFASAPRPAVDYGPVLTKLGVLDKNLAKIRRETDLGPVRKSIADLQARVAGLPVPPDLTPLAERMSRLETIIDEMPRYEPPERVDLEPLGERLALVQQSVRAIRFPPPVKQMDLVPTLEPINERLQVIEAELKQLSEGSSTNDHDLDSPRPDGAPQS